MRCSINDFAFFYRCDFRILIMLMLLLSIEVYINVHSKATAKNHRATNITDHSLYFLFLFMMDVSHRPGSQNSLNKYSFEHFQNSLNARNKIFLFLVVFDVVSELFSIVFFKLFLCLMIFVC